MSTLPAPHLTAEEYLIRERAAPEKSEFYNGEMFLMSGASERHNLVTGALFAQLRQQLRGKPCRVYASDLRVHISRTGLWTYPDVVGVCGARQFHDKQFDTLLNPTFLAEVLSPSTEGYDRGRKSEQYRAIPSLQQYLLLAQDRIYGELYSRQPDDSWRLETLTGQNATAILNSLGCSIKMIDVYEDIEDFSVA